MPTTPKTPISRRGFASMSLEKRRAVARRGGRAAHAKGTAHQFTTDEARAAGAIGGARLAAKYGVNHMSRIGRVGGSKSKSGKGATGHGR